MKIYKANKKIIWEFDIMLCLLTVHEGAECIIIINKCKGNQQIANKATMTTNILITCKLKNLLKIY